MSRQITIINTVPVNGGDEALLQATLMGLRDYLNISASDVFVTTNNLRLCRSYIDYVDMGYDIEYVYLKDNPLKKNRLWPLCLQIRHVINKLGVPYEHVLSQLFASKQERRTIKNIKRSRIILSGAGGYIHDIYGYGDRLSSLEFIHNILGKKVVMFSQSFGPFLSQRSHDSLALFLSKIRTIVREEISLGNLRDIGVAKDRIYLGTDIAFYLYQKYKLPVRTVQNRKVVFCFRSWQQGIKDEEIIEKAATLVALYLEQKDVEAHFISTCQGIKGYVDDSLLARKIVERIPEQKRNRCFVDDKKYNPEQLIEKYANYDVYVGMRLHGSILSMIAGIPVINIGYEDKTKGIFEFLKLESNMSHYSEEPAMWHQLLQDILQNYASHQKKQEESMKRAYEKSCDNFAELKRVYES